MTNIQYKNFNALVVSKSPVILNLVATTMRELGIININRASHISKIQEYFQNNKINLIVGDYQLFNKHSGIILNEIKRHNKKTYLILLLNEEIPSYRLKTLYKCGVNSHLDFPFKIEALVQAIKDAVRTVVVSPKISTDTIKKVRKISFFNLLSDEELGSLLETSKIRKYQADDLIFAEGQRGDRFYVIIQGRVEITKKASSGDEISLALLKQGASFGEMAILDASPRSANAKALDDTLLFELDGKIMECCDDLATLKLFKKLALIFCGRLRDAGIQIGKQRQQK